MKSKKLRIVAIGPFNDLVFNTTTQNCYFRSIESARQAIQDALDEPNSEDGEGHESTWGEDHHVLLKDYRFFREITL